MPSGTKSDPVTEGFENITFIAQATGNFRFVLPLGK